MREMKLADAPVGARLRDRFGVEWKRGVLRATRFQSVGTGWSSTEHSIGLAEEEFGPFTLDPEQPEAERAEWTGPAEPTLHSMRLRAEKSERELAAARVEWAARERQASEARAERAAAVLRADELMRERDALALRVGDLESETADESALAELESVRAAMHAARRDALDLRADNCRLRGEAADLRRERDTIRGLCKAYPNMAYPSAAPYAEAAGLTDAERQRLRTRRADRKAAFRRWESERAARAAVPFGVGDWVVGDDFGDVGRVESMSTGPDGVTVKVANAGGWTWGPPEAFTPCRAPDARPPRTARGIGADPVPYPESEETP